MQKFFIPILFISAFSFSITKAADTRVISLSPAITEIIFALKLDSSLVGTSQFSDYPEKAKQLPSVGPYSKPNLEKIISLKPDLIFIPTEGSDDISHHLERLKISIKTLKMQALDDIPRAAHIIADQLNLPQKGKDFERHWTSSLKKIFSKNKQKNKKIFMVLQSEPLITVGKNTFLNEIVEKCGGENVFKNSNGYPKISTEVLLNTDFDLLLLVEHFQSLSEQKKMESYWKDKMSQLHKNQMPLFSVNPDIATRPGPRLIIGIEKICKIINDANYGS